MTARAGEEFDVVRAVADVEALLAGPVPADGPTVAVGDPATGEWTTTRGEGFRVVPLWEGEALTGLYEPEWNEEVGVAEGHLAALVGELDARWGVHRKVAMHVPLFRRRRGAPVPPLFGALLAEDCYGDLWVWGPVTVEGPGAVRRWVAVSAGHSDGDAPVVMAAAVSDRPVVGLPDEDDCVDSP
ncbi:hypothetical protein [Streptomyces fulvorobeus]|uniref:Uncharacterized protein n=1 Tax=Streptomyces fulvorobeus TaxID=284028 RepID=A0A7J0CAK4_9ACTN|nr:hypothetical protein [Streptomyces fulvorobeus]NYE43124.1 hypothetical protein [Streptomyces fulvorobeus]GFM99570.1 hypothetical protein Sfulv_43810 [Streptomyces fulvorobeus]